MMDYVNKFKERAPKTQLLIIDGETSGKLARSCTASHDYVMVPVVFGDNNECKPLHKGNQDHIRFVNENVTPNEFRQL